MDEANKPLPESQVDPVTRANARKQLHKQKQEQRQRDVEQRKNDYVGIKDSPALADILSKAKEFRSYYNKLAVDGVGSRVAVVDGKQVIEEVILSDSQVARNLGSVSSLTQLITYIENQLT